MKIVGMSPNSFTAGDTGEVIAGKNIYGTYPLRRDGAVGCGVDKVYLTDRRIESVGGLAIGDEIEVIRNKEGKVTRVLKLAPIE